MIESNQVLRQRLAQTASCQETVRSMDLFPGLNLGGETARQSERTLYSIGRGDGARV